MNLLTGQQHDGTHASPNLGSYAWWYTDVLSNDGEWGVVVIFFRGMPMSPSYLDAQDLGAGSPSDHCGYAVSVYHRFKKVAYAFREINEADLPKPGNDVLLDTLHPDVPQQIKVRITLADGMIDSSGTPYGPHSWVLVAPRATATVDLSLTEHGIEQVRTSWNGLAYRDHNVGAQPLQQDFRDWFWGRVHGEDRTLVFLTTPNASEPFVYCGEIRQGARVMAPWSDLKVRHSQFRASMMGLWSSRVVEITGTDTEGSRRTVRCANRNVVEDGPFYQRYLSVWTLDGQTIGSGTSEYMRADRLAKRWVRPFLRLPFFRHD